MVVVAGWGRGTATRAGILECDFTAMSMLFFSGIINNMEKAQSFFSSDGTFRKVSSEKPGLLVHISQTQSV